jgi:hypothetical protein
VIGVGVSSWVIDIQPTAGRENVRYEEHCIEASVRASPCGAENIFVRIVDRRQSLKSLARASLR